VLDEQLRRRGLRENGDTESLRLLSEKPAERGDRDDDVAVVPHRRRRRDAHCRAPGHEVYGLSRDFTVGRNVRQREPALEELPERPRVDDRAGEEMRAGLLALLDHGDGDFAEPFLHLGILLE
jgi:hypothetical protein